MKFFILLRSSILLFTLLIAFHAEADWLNLTGAETAPNIAEIYILDDHIKVQLEIYPDNLESFKELIPDDWTEDMKVKRPSLEERQANFSKHTLAIKTKDGEFLPAQFGIVEPRMRVNRQSPLAGMINPYTGRRIPDAPADKRVIYAEIVYPFKGKPEQLQIIPPLDRNGTALVTLGFIAYHRSVPVIDFRYLGQAETLKLDWQDPWYTEFENRNLTRHHKYPLMLYLYVEPGRVRLESLMRVGDIAEMTGFNRSDTDDKAGEHARLQKHVTDFALRESALDIDGNIAHPDLVNISYFVVGLAGLMPVDNPATIDDASLLVGVSRHYYINALPKKIHSIWPYFNPHVDKVPFVETDPAGPLPGFIYPEDPIFSWDNLLKTYEEPALRPLDMTTGWRFDLPLIGETTLFKRTPDKPQAQTIISGMLENLRIAYVEKNPSAFAHIIEEIILDPSGTLVTELSKLYAPPMKRGGVGEVKEFGDLDINEIRTLENPDGFSATMTGYAVIQAMHWGHTDQMQLQFQLLLDLVEQDNQWRLNDMTVIDLKESKQ